jgi:hypothetical protein
MRIVLHIGAPKTGSSALQSAFVLNRDALIERGIFYPRSHTDAYAVAGIPVSGNAIALAKFFNPNLSVAAEEWDFNACAAAIDRARGTGCSTVLYSSEYMSFFLSEQMDDFLARAATFGAWVEIVYFVRNIAGHAMSSYRQHLKKGRFHGTFAAYIKRGYRPRFSYDIERSIATVGRERLTVLVFDDLRKSLFPSMIEAMGHVSHSLPSAPDINSSTDGVTPSDDENAAIAARWSDEIGRINEMLGRQVLSTLAANLLALLNLLVNTAPDAYL